MIKAANASRHAGRGGADEDEDDGPTRSSVDEVEMGLLAHDEHASSAPLRFASVGREGYVESEEEEDGAVGVRDGYGYGHGEAAAATTTTVPLTREDKKAMALLIILCASLSSLVFHPTATSPLYPPSASTVMSCRR